MVEELKAELRKLENLIGCQEKVDVTSRSFTKDLIRALVTKYKSDLQKSIRLHRLEFYRELIENARQKQRKKTDVEEKFLLAKKKEKEEDKEKEAEKKQAMELEQQVLKKPDDVVSVQPKDIDEWKDLMTLSRIYYVLEHPNSTGLTWERRITKKKSIPKFTDKDLVEWRVAQHFRLKGLEEWALSRNEARKLADQSPYDFDDLLEDDESRELEDMFHILDTQRQKKRKVGQLEKALKTSRPFRFKDEGIEDWTESYSDDSEESGAEDMLDEALEIEEEPQFKLDDYKISSEEPTIDEEETISEIFSTYKEISKYRNPVLEEMDKAETMERWFSMCSDALGEARPLTPETLQEIQGMYTIDEAEEEEYEDSMLEREPEGFSIRKKFLLTEATEEEIEKPGEESRGREVIPLREATEKEIEKPGDESRGREAIPLREATSKEIEKPGDESRGREVLPVREATSKEIEKPGDESRGREVIPLREATSKEIEKPGDESRGREVIPLREATEKEIEKPTSETMMLLDIRDSIDKLFDQMEAMDEELGLVEKSESEVGLQSEKLADDKKDLGDLAEDHKAGTDVGTISKGEEEAIESEIQSLVKKGEGFSGAEDKTPDDHRPESPPQDSDLESLLRKDSEAAKLRVASVESKDKSATSTGTIGLDAERAVHEDLKRVLKEAKSSALSKSKESVRRSKSKEAGPSAKSHEGDLERKESIASSRIAGKTDSKGTLKTPQAKSGILSKNKESVRRSKSKEVGPSDKSHDAGTIGLDNESKIQLGIKSIIAEAKPAALLRKSSIQVDANESEPGKESSASDDESDHEASLKKDF